MNYFRDKIIVDFILLMEKIKTNLGKRKDCYECIDFLERYNNIIKENNIELLYPTLGQKYNTNEHDLVLYKGNGVYAYIAHVYTPIIKINGEIISKAMVYVVFSNEVMDAIKLERIAFNSEPVFFSYDLLHNDKRNN